MRFRFREDTGSALVMVIMMLVVVSALGVSVLHVADHLNNATSVDRERLQTVQAAEGGVNDAIRRLELGAGCDVNAGAFNNLNDRDGLVGRFRTRIDPESGTLCGDTPRRVIHSWGYAPTGVGSEGGSGTRALRHLEVTVELVPTDGFPFTLFAEGNNGTIYVKNTGIVDGDVYAETVDQTKNNLTAQNVISTGSIETKNGVVYAGTLWAGGNVDIGEDGNIGGSIIASGTAPSTAGNVTLDNGVVVGGDVSAKGSVAPSTAVVNGSISANNPNVPAPPALSKPVFTWDASNYNPATTTEGTAAAITTALNTNKNTLSGTYHALPGTGTVTFPSGATIAGDFTLVADKIVTSGNLKASGGPWQVAFVALSPDADALTTTGSFSAVSTLNVLMYAVGGFDMKNNVNFKGAIYADTIDAKNSFTIVKSTSLMLDPPEGFNFVYSQPQRYTAVPTLWREIVPGLPPS
jgi:hypothetical protein